MDFKTRKKYYNICSPYEYLEPEDTRNVDLDAFGEEDGHRVRGVNWVDNLVEEIALSDEPTFKLFTGHMGSGKTTELKRLAKRLSNPDEANLFPVFINAENILDLASRIDVTDIIAAVVYSVERAVIENEDSSEKALEEAYLKRFWNWLKNTDVDFGKGEFSIPSAGKLIFEMKSRPTLRQRIRGIVTSNFLEFITNAKQELEKFNLHVITKNEKSGIVIIFDSLEKLRGITSNWHEVLESAEQVFSGGAPYVRLPVHVLYTVPPSLTTRITGVDFLPMIKVHDKNSIPYELGIEAVRELIRRRIPDDILVEIFGTGSEDRINRIILQSGGYPREVIRMLQMSIAQKKHPLSDRAFEHIIAKIANEYLMVVPGEAFNWLASVAKSKLLTIEDDDHRRVADLMLANHAIMRYLNDELWFELHPALYQIPGVKKAINDIKD
ncbi:MAG: hypothetical protein GY795_07310 [Desulfobacterales bacterium]|nr:hypothetical protein [Desulfobacterales bacterium]